MNEDRLTGNAKNFGGQVEEGFGRATGDVKTQLQGKARERYGRGQGTVPFGQPDECDEEDKAGGEPAEYNGKQRPNEKVGAQAGLSLRL